MLNYSLKEFSLYQLRNIQSSKTDNKLAQSLGYLKDSQLES